MPGAVSSLSVALHSAWHVSEKGVQEGKRRESGTFVAKHTDTRNADCGEGALTATGGRRGTTGALSWELAPATPPRLTAGEWGEPHQSAHWSTLCGQT